MKDPHKELDRLNAEIIKLKEKVKALMQQRKDLNLASDEYYQTVDNQRLEDCEVKK